MNETARTFFRFGAPLFSWALFIFILSSIPGDNIPPIDIPFLDKAVHFLEYFILGILTGRWLLRSCPGLTMRAWAALAVGLAVLYGFLDEWHQSFVPGRSADWRDLIFDLLGAAAGVWILIKARGRAIAHRGRS